MTPADLHFLRPWWLAALLPLALLLWRLRRHGGGASDWRGLVDPHLLPHLLVDDGGAARRIAPALLGLGWLLGVLALAGPTWERLPQPVYQAQQYRVLLLDISREMDAADVPPSRMAQARFETLDLLQRSGEGQTALIAYAAEPYVISPLSADADTIALQVPALSSELLPVQGRNAAPALEKALELLRNAGARDGAVILISGGMDDPAAAQSAARALREAGHRLSVLGVGTAAGAPVPAGDGGFLQDAAGNILLPRLDPEQLGALADAGGGRYLPSRPDDRDLDALLAKPLVNRAARQQQSLRGDQWRELGPWLLLPLLLLGALAFRRGWFSPLAAALLALGLAGPPRPALAFGWDDLWSRPDQRGARAMNAEQPEQAAALFRDPAWRAAAHYRSGNYPQSLAELENLPGSEPAYNRGNALARMGRLEDAIAAYDQALAQDPGHRDARRNRELLEQLLQKQQEQNQEQQQPREPGQDGEPEDKDGSGSQPGDKDQQNQPGQQAGQGQEEQTGQGPQGQQEQQTGQGRQDPGTQGESNPSDESRQSGDRDQQAGPGDRQPEDGDQPRDKTRREQPRNPPGEQGGPTQTDAPGREDLGEQAPPPGDPGPAAGYRPEEGPVPESAQAMEQWLRRVPDDPAGLLRQRILLQHLRNRGEL